jgi:hypothetical protein
VALSRCLRASKVRDVSDVREVGEKVVNDSFATFSHKLLMVLSKFIFRLLFFGMQCIIERGLFYLDTKCMWVNRTYTCSHKCA